jgi:HSP20 family molecular chaperone IbpA
MATNEAREIEARDKEVLMTEDPRTGVVFRPDVDILEEPDAFVIHADMPGASEETVDVQLEKGLLTLQARLAETPGDEPAPSTPSTATAATTGSSGSRKMSTRPPSRRE